MTDAPWYPPEPDGSPGIGWREHAPGHPMPCDPDAVVEVVKRRQNEIGWTWRSRELARDVDWLRLGNPFLIVAWRYDCPIARRLLVENAALRSELVEMRRTLDLSECKPERVAKKCLKQPPPGALTHADQILPGAELFLVDGTWCADYLKEYGVVPLAYRKVTISYGVVDGWIGIENEPKISAKDRNISPYGPNDYNDNYLACTAEDAVAILEAIRKQLRGE